MRRFVSAFSVIAILLAVAGCGSTSRQLQSMAISPATASGQAQFVATGHYNQAPLNMSPLPVLWAIYPPGGETGATITQGGLAQCEPAASGTFWVFAWAPADPSIPIGQIETAKQTVVGTAFLTCP